MSRRCATRAPQSGVALITVLAVMLFTGLLIGALFGLLATSMRVNEAAERSAREQRAADAGIQTAISQLDGDPCAQPGLYLDDLVFNEAIPEQDVSVDVECRPAGEGSTMVQILGRDGYQGPLQWTADCAGGGGPPGCLAWGNVGGVPGGLDTSGASLIHGGPEPLRFSHGVDVRSGAAALRSDGGAPAISIGRGTYRQGREGLLGSGDDCGLLDGEPGDGQGRIDAPGGVECGNGEVAALTIGDTGLRQAPLPTGGDQTAPACGGGVTQFQPGTYDHDATEAVSRLLDGSTGCSGVFHFTPGVYEFQGSELRFGQTGSTYVFGERVLAPAPGGPLCDTERPGATLVISAATRILHTGGRVAVCPHIPDGSAVPDPAIQQTSSVTSSVTAERVGGGSVRFRCGMTPLQTAQTRSGWCNNPTTERVDVALSATGAEPVGAAVVTARIGESRPTNWVSDRSIRLRLVAPGGGQVCEVDPQPGPTGSETEDGPVASFELAAGGCAGPLSSMTVGDLDGHTLQLDVSMLLGRPTLQGVGGVGGWAEVIWSDVAVEVHPNTSSSGTFAGVTGAADQWVAATLPNVRTPGGGLAEPQMPCAEWACRVPGAGVTLGEPWVHEFTLSGVQVEGLEALAADDVDPSITSLHAVVDVEVGGDEVTWLTLGDFGAGAPAVGAMGNLVRSAARPDMTTVVRLQTQNGAACGVAQGGVAWHQSLWLDLLGPSAPPGCDTTFAQLSELGDLSTAQVSVRFEMPCFRRTRSAPNCFLKDGEALRVRPPSVDHVRLVVGTDTYDGPPARSEIAVAGDDTVLHAYGRAALPFTDLDLEWRGQANTSPLFGEGFIVRALASHMRPGSSTGEVCCDLRGSNRVELVALVDGEPRLSTLVELVPSPDGTGPTVQVVDWQTCTRSGCGPPVAAARGSEVTEN